MKLLPSPVVHMHWVLWKESQRNIYYLRLLKDEWLRNRVHRDSLWLPLKEKVRCLYLTASPVWLLAAFSFSYIFLLINWARYHLKKRSHRTGKRGDREDSPGLSIRQRPLNYWINSKPLILLSSDSTIFFSATTPLEHHYQHPPVC